MRKAIRIIAVLRNVGWFVWMLSVALSDDGIRTSQDVFAAIWFLTTPTINILASELKRLGVKVPS
jgi:hypothetical protein